jgi:hypothetical protein
MHQKPDEALVVAPVKRLEIIFVCHLSTSSPRRISWNILKHTLAGMCSLVAALAKDTKIERSGREESSRG